jgi:glutathione peroxidase
MQIRILSIPFALALAFASNAAMASCSELLDRSFRPLADKTPVNLCDQYAGKVLLVVNTASKCGYTPQYEGLEKLHEDLAPRGFAVVGFPSNDFSGQEPGTEDQIKEFCTNTYGIKFPMYQKLTVKGPEADPLYKQLATDGGGEPGWNFHKYLISRDGKVLQSFPSKIAPDDPKLREAIEDALKGGS